MAAPDFSPATIRLLGSRSSLICNNPECATVTVGADDSENNVPLALKIGEAAHICAARDGEARFVKTMSITARADFSNGIWLCASCHTMIDKNKGAGFLAEDLRKWKADHEAMIKALLLSHRSPLRFLRGFTEETNTVRKLIDLLEQHGAMFQDMVYEKPPYVDSSIKYLREAIKKAIADVEYDRTLKRHLKSLGKAFLDYMNHTGKFPTFSPPELETLRNRVGIFLLTMEKDYGLQCVGRIREIMPN